MKMKKRLFAILLAFCVAFTMMPIAGSGGVAHAEDGIAANADLCADVISAFRAYGADHFNVRTLYGFF